MKLISMTDFVLDQGNPSNTDCQFADKVMSYANFLKQPLELWMFVPCKLVDAVWVVLKKPIEPEPPYNDKECDVWVQYEMYLRRYQQAKERCLFEGFELSVRQIEHLIKLKITIEECNHDLYLTQTAIKQIGL